MRSRLLRLLLVPALALCATSVPRTAVAAEPPLGDAVTLEDGTVLPPMPADQVVPTLQSEQLAEHATSLPDGPADEPAAVEPLAEVGALQAGEGAIAGPGGALPNSLRREVLGFLPHWSLGSTTRASLRYDLLSTIAYFSIGVNSNGSLDKGTTAAPDPGWQGWRSAAMTEVINSAHARGVRVVPTISLMSWSGDYTALRTLLESPTNRARLVSEVVALVRDRRADGVNVDFEPVHSSLRTQFTTLVRELKAGLVKAGVGSYLTVDTMAGAAAWATGYDVVALTAKGAADALMVMAYDFSYAGSARAGGVAPIESDYLYASADAMRDHLARVPASKLIWGVPHYGRAWNTQTAAVNSPVRTPAQSVAFSYHFTDSDGVQGGRALAANYGRKWDRVGQVPWFVFHDANSGGYRQGYYEDPASLRVKYDHVLRNGLAGVGIWALGMDNGVPDLWNVIREKFVKVVTRQGGSDRYGTAAAVSAATFAPGVPAAYIATGAKFPDALAAGPVAGRAGGPVLLTTASSLPASTATELGRLRPARIFVLGGPTAVSDAVLSSLRAYATSGTVTRISGADRYGTAAAASAATFAPGAPVAYVATGANFPDALAGGTAAGREDGPILLTSRTAIPRATANELARLKPARIVVVGGTAAVSDAVLTALRGYATTGTVTRLAGADRYATAVAISRATSTADADGTVYVAAGASFADGLSGTPPAVRVDGPLLTVPSTSLPAAVASELRRLDPGRVVILGGPAAVSDAVLQAIRDLWD
jgi:spore germination protein YaaH/putative cell wall-binding protein